MLKVRFALLLVTLSISLTFALDICEHQSNGVRLAHPADCNKFVICRNGLTAVIRTCPNGLHFNRFIGACDLKERAACDIEFVQLADREVDCSACCAVCGCDGSTPEPPTPETPTPEPPCPGTPTPGTPTPGTPVTPTPETPGTPGHNCGNNITVCVNKPNNDVSYVNGTCNQYIVCSNGCGHIMNCPNNLQYNLNTHRCDYPENVDCPWTSKPPTTGPSGVTCAQSGECAGKKDGTMFADPNTNGYIICQCECEIEMPCPVGTKFDGELNVCTNTNSTGNGSSGSGSNTGNGGNNGNGSNTGNGGNDGNGSNTGNGGNNGNGNGNSTTIVTCVTGVCKEGDLLLPVDGECNKFYQCNNDCAIEIICPNNLIYNPTKKQCDYPQNYNCPWPYTPPSGPSEGPSGIACASGGRCIDQPEGAYLPSLASKSKYVVCQCQCEVERDCPDNLVWDIKKSTCNWPNA